MEKFIINFANQLLDADANELTANTLFRELDDWDSLTAMAVLAMISDEYKVKIDELAFRELKTIGDIYNFVVAAKTV
jgi:acyl carrier protein